MLGLGLVQADALDVLAQFFLAEREDFLGRVGDREQVPRRGIHADIGGLRRQHHRDQQLERRLVFQLGGGVRVGRLQAQKDFAAFGGVHGVGLKNIRCLSHSTRVMNE